MLRLLVRTGIVITFLTMIVFVVRLITFVNTQHPYKEVFHTEECQHPCWLGITPGKTTMGDAKSIFDRHPDLLRDVDFANGVRPTLCAKTHTAEPWKVCVVSWNRAKEGTSPEDVASSYIEFIPPKQKFMLGQAMMLWGEPVQTIQCWGGEYPTPLSDAPFTGMTVSFAGQVSVYTHNPWQPETQPYEPNMVISAVRYTESEWISESAPPWQGFSKDSILPVYCGME